MASGSANEALGRAIDQWSRCEAWISQILSDLIHVELDIGHTIVSNLTAAPKRELLERVAAITRMPDELRGELREICREFERLTSQRNRIVHGEWVHLASGTSYRVGVTKHLRYFDRWHETGEDPQKAIFTQDMIEQFENDGHALMMRFYNLAMSEAWTKRFPAV